MRQPYPSKPAVTGQISSHSGSYLPFPGWAGEALPYPLKRQETPSLGIANVPQNLEQGPRVRLSLRPNRTKTPPIGSPKNIGTTESP